MAFRAAVPKDGEKAWEFEAITPKLQGIIDTGTNITVSSKAVATELGKLGLLKIIERKSPTNDLGRVRFGKKDAVAEILMIVKGGGAVDWIAIVDEIDVCLISVGWFTQARDMEVSFDKHSCKLKYKDTIVLEGVYDDSLGMYTLDMLELITAPDPRIAIIAKELQVDQCYAARRVQRFRQAVVIKALALHRHTGCLPFETMAICIERKAWGGIDPGITPALCRELGRKKACLVCALCRWRQEVFEGTGIKPSYSKKDIGKYIVTDCGGKVTPASYGNHYFQYVGCPLIKHHRVYGQKGKDGESLGSIRLWLIYALQHGHTPQYLLTDGGSEVESDMASELYARWGIKCIPTPGKIPLFSAEREMQLKYDDIEALLLSVQTWTASNWLDAAIHSAQMRSYTSFPPSI